VARFQPSDPVAWVGRFKSIPDARLKLQTVRLGARGKVTRVLYSRVTAGPVRQAEVHGLMTARQRQAHHIVAGPSLLRLRYLHGHRVLISGVFQIWKTVFTGY
jgi:hypothetical protein